MFKIFEHKKTEEELPSSGMDGYVKEHMAFAQWLERQPTDRKEMYLQLAMAYGFRMSYLNRQQDTPPPAEEEENAS